MILILKIMISIAISIFTIQVCWLAVNNKETFKKRILSFDVRVRHPAGDRRTGSFLNDAELFFDEIGAISILGIKIRSLGDLYLFRIIFALSLLLIFISLGFFLDNNYFYYSAVVALIAYFLPGEMLKSKTHTYAKDINNELPDVIDIMASLISAGLTLDEVMLYISKNFRGAAGRLFELYRIKILEGKRKSEAFEIIGRLSFCMEFKSFVKVLYQSEVIGFPVKEILADLARVYRNNQRDLLKMRAERLESNLTIIIFVFIFIPMLMIFLIPVMPQIKLLLA